MLEIDLMFLFIYLSYKDEHRQIHQSINYYIPIYNVNHAHSPFLAFLESNYVSLFMLILQLLFIPLLFIE